MAKELLTVFLNDLYGLKDHCVSKKSYDFDRVGISLRQQYTFAIENYAFLPNVLIKAFSETWVLLDSLIKL